MSTFDNTDDIIDVRDVISRVETLREERDALTEAKAEAYDEFEETAGVMYQYCPVDRIDNDAKLIGLRDALASAQVAVDAWAESDEAKELETLESLLSDLAGYGGDEQWEGDWYPVTLIQDGYFETYAQELAEEIGAIDRNASWPNTCIDWEQAARELQQDYSSVEFDGVTYWYR